MRLYIEFNTSSQSEIKMEVIFNLLIENFCLISISGNGLGGLVLLYKFVAKRVSFLLLTQKDKEEILLFPILCKVEKENKPFIITQKERVSLGYTQGNAWLKPYKCKPNLLSTSSFGGGRFYIYKADCILKFLIRLCRLCGNEAIKEIKISERGKSQIFCCATYNEALCICNEENSKIGFS